MLCLVDWFDTTMLSQLTEITQFIFGQPLSKLLAGNRERRPTPANPTVRTSAPTFRHGGTNYCVRTLESEHQRQDAEAVQCGRSDLCSVAEGFCLEWVGASLYPLCE